MLKSNQSLEASRTNGEGDYLTIEASRQGLFVTVSNFENQRRARIFFEDGEAILRWLDSLRLPILEALGHDLETEHLKVGGND